MFQVRLINTIGSLLFVKTESGTFHKVPLSIGISFLRYKKDCGVLIVDGKVKGFYAYLQ